MKKSNLLLIPLIIFPIITWSTKISAHGSQINYRSTRAIEIKATYDDGTPMALAQVVIYAPNDPTSPWIEGQPTLRGILFSYLIMKFLEIGT
ncbi:MAG: hypothetical protein ACFBSE_03660 [Prochloraceae cyanobacterium]